jgi:hypothetical protein
VLTSADITIYDDGVLVDNGTLTFTRVQFAGTQTPYSAGVGYLYITGVTTHFKLWAWATDELPRSDFPPPPYAGPFIYLDFEVSPLHSGGLHIAKIICGWELETMLEGYVQSDASWGRMIK